MGLLFGTKGLIKFLIKFTAKEITLDASSKLELTGDCYVTALDDADASYANIDFGGYKLYVNGTAIN